MMKMILLFKIASHNTGTGAARRCPSVWGRCSALSLSELALAVTRTGTCARYEHKTKDGDGAPRAGGRACHERRAAGASKERR